jgi:DNA-binding IclR family transcriptional regulator
MAANTRNPEKKGESTYHTRAVSRAFQILNSFTIQEFELSVGDLHDKLGIHKSTLVRLLQSMAAEGFIEQNPETGGYRLGIRTFELGNLYQRTYMMNIGVLARPSLKRLAADLNLSANLAVRDESEIVYVETVEPPGSAPRLAYSAGDRFGIHHTALGKALIAFLPGDELEDLLAELELPPLTPRTITTPDQLAEDLAEVRERGYAVDDEESLPGLRCVSAPIWNSERVAAALSASGSTLVVTAERVPEIAKAVIGIARALSAQLGGVPPR